MIEKEVKCVKYNRKKAFCFPFGKIMYENKKKTLFIWITRYTVDKYLYEK